MSTTRPWYRQAWPWGLMAAPLAAVIMGVLMTVLAVRSYDGLVVDDYYKQGLAINQVLSREAKAAELGVSAALVFAPERDRVRLTVTGRAGQLDGTTLRLVHPTRAGRDQTVELAPVGPGMLEARFAAPLSGRWRLVLEGPGGAWRLTGAWHTDDASVTLAPAAPG